MKYKHVGKRGRRSTYLAMPVKRYRPIASRVRRSRTIVNEAPLKKAGAHEEKNRRKKEVN